MAESRRERGIQMVYSFDRLANLKISQVYKLLVPEKIKPCNTSNSDNIKNKGDVKNEVISDLLTSIIGEAKRRTNYR